jgi:hypothetical protein
MEIEKPSTHAMRVYEEETFAPLIREAGFEPHYGNQTFTMIPGSTVFLMNGAEDYTYENGLYTWNPLQVLYCDKSGHTDTVYTITASMEPQSQMVQLQRAELTNIAALIRDGGSVIWKDAYSGRVFIRYPDHEADKVLMNSWYLFRGAVLPMLEREMYRFVEDHERLAFQQTMIRHINMLYEGLV